MPSTQLKERFRAWNSDPARNRMADKSYPKTLDGSKLMLEDALWIAYEEGYRQCQEDVKAAIDKLGHSR